MLSNNKQNNDFTKILETFRPISLKEMDSVKLMNRFDTKYFFNSSLIKDILLNAQNKYKVLEINNTRQFLYLTTYYDTPEFILYNDHLHGKMNRIKIRQRRYDITGTEFFEIKFKTNKGFTLKSRIENNCSEELNDSTENFLKSKTQFHNSHLNKVIRNDFIRITLVNNEMTERATLDYNLSFSNFRKSTEPSQVGILEIKMDKQSGTSDLVQIMKNLGIRPKGISKYCLGVALLYDNVKSNRFKPQITKINHLNYEHTAIH